mgnify:FL=1
MTQGRRYWLMKSEPRAFSIEDLEKSPKRTTCWDGVRNYQARNFMRAMAVGDHVLFYHSNAEPPVVVGIAEVVRTAYPDETQFDKTSHHYDPASVPLLHGGIWWTSGIVRRSRPVCRSTD